MADPDGIDHELRLSSLLAAYHDSITGRPLSDSRAESIETLDENSLIELSKAQACVDLLEAARHALKAESMTSGGRKGGAGPADPLEAQSLDCGHRIGRFEIVRLLGHGGHSLVYLARDPTLGRYVALKIPRLHLLVSETVRRRFLQEAQAIAVLRHPNIVSIYERSAETRIPYIVEEYCDGPNLAEWLRQREEDQRPVSPAAAAKWVRDLADATAHAHDNGMIHRDLKPANILLQTAHWPLDRSANGSQSRANGEAGATGPRQAEPEQLVPRITDFGLAKLFLAEESLTLTKSVMGTAAYMAPEQAEGKTREVGPAADIYSLGVILYELLTGRRPIEGQTDAEILRRLATEEPIPVRRIRRDVPWDLDAICLKCLEKDARKRYPKATDLASELTRFLQGEPVLVRRPGAIRRLARRMRRRQFSARAALLGLLVFGLLFAVIGGFQWRTGQQQKAAQATLERARLERAAALPKIYANDVRRADLLLQHTASFGTDRQKLAGDAREILAAYLPSAGEPDLRGFEWHYLWKIAHPESHFARFPQLQAIQAHARDAYCVTFSPDGKLLATAGADCKVRTWSAEGGQPRLTLTGHTHDVNCVQFSPDGKTLATASEDGTVRLWDASTGAQRKILWQHQAEVVGVAFNPSNGQLAAGAHDGVLKIWDLAKRQEITIREAHDGHRIDAMLYSPDGAFLATVGGNCVRVWNAGHSYLPVAAFYGRESQALAFSHDGALLAVGHPSEVRLYRFPTRELLTRFALPGKHIRSLQFTNDDRSLIAAGDERTACALDLTTGKLWNPFETAGTIWCLACARDGRRMATSDSTGMLRFWDCSLCQSFHRINLDVRKGVEVELALSPDGRSLATAGGGPTANASKGNGDVIIWDISGPQPMLMRKIGTNTISEYTTGITFTPDSKRILYSRWDPKRPSPDTNWELRVVDVASGVERCAVRERTAIYCDPRLSGNGRILVTQYREANHPPAVMGFAQFRDFPSGRLLNTLPLRLPGYRIALSPLEDVLALALGDRPGHIELLRTSDQKRLATLPKEFTGQLSSLEFAKDGRFLIARDVNGWVVFLDRASGQVTHQVNVPEIADFGSPASLSPDGCTLAFGSRIGVLLAHVEKGQVLCTLPFPKPVESVNTIAFGSDGRTIAANGQTADGQCGVYLWQADR